MKIIRKIIQKIKDEIIGYISWLFHTIYIYEIKFLKSGKVCNVKVTLHKKSTNSQLEEIIEKEEKESVLIINKECIYYSSFLVKLFNMLIFWNLFEYIFTRETATIFIAILFYIMQKLLIIENKV